MRTLLGLARIVTTIVLAVAGLGWEWPTFFHDSCPLDLIVHARTLYDRDGIQLQGTARIVTYKASVCRVSEEHQSEPEYEEMKSNHGGPLHVGQLDFSAYNGTGKSLAHLRADFEIESVWPPCTNWSGLNQYYRKGMNNSVRKNKGMDEIEPIFPGNPITKSFNSKLSFGILIPLDLWKQIKNIASKGTE